MNEEGFVKDYRSVLSWEWFTDPLTAHLWEYIRLKASYKPIRYRGIEIPRGAFIESRQSMSANTGISERSVRTALAHLCATGEIVTKQTRYGLLIFCINYAKFQSQGIETDQPTGQHSDHEVTSNRPATDQQPTSNRPATDQQSNFPSLYNEQEYKEIKKERRERDTRPRAHKIKPSLREVEDFILTNDLQVDPGKFFHHYQATDWKINGDPITDWKSKILEWDVKDSQGAKELPRMRKTDGSEILDDFGLNAEDD